MSTDMGHTEAVISPAKAVVLEQAKLRWLSTAEVLDIIVNHEEYGLPLSVSTPWRAPNGTVCLYDRNIVKSYRKDGYSWRRQADNRSNGSYRVLKVDGRAVLRCSYTYTDDGRFQLRVHSLVDKQSAYSHLSLAQYREVGERSARARAASQAVAASRSRSSSLDLGSGKQYAFRTLASAARAMEHKPARPLRTTIGGIEIPEMSVIDFTDVARPQAPHANNHVSRSPAHQPQQLLRSPILVAASPPAPPISRNTSLDLLCQLAPQSLDEPPSESRGSPTAQKSAQPDSRKMQVGFLLN